MKQKISLVAAVAKNFAIGKDNQLMWHLPNDLKFFKKYTTGKIIVMGRKTFESVGSRPLPNRLNIVLSKSEHTDAENLKYYQSLDKIFEDYKDAEEICFVGGSKIYEMGMKYATHLVLTRVDTERLDAEVFFPKVNFEEWNLVFSEIHLADEKHAFHFTFEEWERK